MVINNVWLKNVKSFFTSAIVDDPARSCFPQSRLSCTSCICKLPASHHTRLAKVLKGRSKRSWAGMGRHGQAWAGKRRSFSFTFSSMRTSPPPVALPQAHSRSSFTSGNNESAQVHCNCLDQKLTKTFPALLCLQAPHIGIDDE
jgi:hypothetical protein